MKFRKYGTVIIQVLLCGSMVASISFIGIKYSKVSEQLEQKEAALSQSYNVISDQSLRILKDIHLKKENQDLQDQVDLIKEKLNRERESFSAEREEFSKELQRTKTSYEQKIEKLSSAKFSPAVKSQSGGRTFTATYYDAGYKSTGKNPGHPAYGKTASGKMVETGVTVAVDPRVIPLGSWLLVTYPDGHTEKRRADDTGGAIKGMKIDIYVPNVKGYGKHDVTVKVLSTPDKS